MESALNVLGCLFMLASLGSCVGGVLAGPLIQIEGAIFMVIAAVFFGSAAIVGAINKLRVRAQATPANAGDKPEWDH